MSYWTTAFAGQYVRVSADLELYYDEAGSGRPLIFITGWTGTNEFFIPYQLSHFSQKYHVVAYDPRSQGRSTGTRRETPTHIMGKIYVPLWKP